MAKLDRDEIEKSVEKLKEEYSAYAMRYGEKRFNWRDLYQRYLDAERAKIDMDSFILAEMQTLTKLKEIVEGKKEEEKKATFSERVDGMLDEFEQRIAAYPKIDIHPLAQPEVKHLFGGLIRFVETTWPVLLDIVDDAGHPAFFRDIQHRLDDLGRPDRTGIPRRVHQHAMLLNQVPKDFPAIDRDRMEILKEAGLVLNTILDRLHGLSAAADSTEIYTEPMGRLKALITDFRLTGFRKK